MDLLRAAGMLPAHVFNSPPAQSRPPLYRRSCALPDVGGTPGRGADPTFCRIQFGDTAAIRQIKNLRYGPGSIAR